MLLPTVPWPIHALIPAGFHLPGGSQQPSLRHRARHCDRPGAGRQPLLNLQLPFPSSSVCEPAPSEQQQPMFHCHLFGFKCSCRAALYRPKPPTERPGQRADLPGQRWTGGERDGPAPPQARRWGDSATRRNKHSLARQYRAVLCCAVLPPCAPLHPASHQAASAAHTPCYPPAPPLQM